MHRGIFWVVTLVVLLVVLGGAGWAAQVAPMEIHTKHWIFGYPLGTPATNDLIIRDIYALSSNDTTKFADWVAYRLDQATVDGGVTTRRTWQSDPWLAPHETLEPEDYRGAHAALQTDRGHLAPLGAFKGTPYWAQTNYLSNITPQKSALNQGLWSQLENTVRDFVRQGQVVWVLTGPLYEEAWATLPHADELHTIPSGYWKILVRGDETRPDSVQAVAFLFPQTTPRQSILTNFIATIDEIEHRTGLNFLWELPEGIETAIESQLGTWPFSGNCLCQEK